MMRPLLLLICLATLAACGADGEPTPPDAGSGLSVSGTVRVGVSGGS
ncbi:hypothetical protein DEA8626_02428 [Defluviimonas aquaemixtae]|uniref:Argininosuccinate lyase n=1 Tax=Albidovulum aquaemixtae TaxID=1542388 RepID=A0A2R8BIX9_9RHOB|nr:argininosuccinate lyase [Defluviimonas aquaemixtae]SPH23364.1 hypothetical protein DEA8626_02428 [Defluviimonas aquaemixtae]